MFLGVYLIKKKTVPVMDQFLACFQTRDKSLSEPMMTQFSYVYIPHRVLTHWPLGDLNKNLDRYVIFKLISVTDGRGISCKIALRWMPLDLTDDKSTLVQVMAWCRQAPSHYLSQCWPRSMSPNGVTRPQSVNELKTHWSLENMLATL